MIGHEHNDERNKGRQVACLQPSYSGLAIHQLPSPQEFRPQVFVVVPLAWWHNLKLLSGILEDEVVVRRIRRKEREVQVVA